MKGKASFVRSGANSASVEPTGFCAFPEGATNLPEKKSFSKGRESVDFEVAISHAGYGKFNYFLLLVSMPVAFSSIMVTVATSLVIPAIGCEFKMNNFEKGGLQIAPFLGMTISAFIWGSISDSFGRRKLLIYGYILDGLSGIAASLAPSLWIMIFLKIANGALNSGPFSIFSAYISETFPKDYRDNGVLFCGLFSSIATVVQPILCFLITWYLPLGLPWTVFGGYQISSWRLFLVTCSLPSLIAGICCIFSVESPKFLLDKGRKEEALTVLKTVYTINTALPASEFPVCRLRDMRSASIVASSALLTSFWERVGTGMSKSFSIFQKPYIGRAVFYFIIQFGAMAGANGIRLWLPQMFATAETAASSNSTSSDCGICDLITASGDPVESSECEATSPGSYVNMVIVNCGILVSYPLFFFVVKFFGKKTGIIISTLVPSFFVFAIPLVPATYVVYIALMHLSLVSLAFYALLASVVETFPTSVRATSVSVTQTIGRIGILAANCFVSTFVFEYCSTVMYTLAAILLVAGIVAVMLPTSPINLGLVGKSNKNSAEQT